MGMFDEFHFNAEPLRCAAGHAIRHVQTKSLANRMEHFHVFAGRVFLAEGLNEEESDSSAYSIEGDHLVYTTTSRMPPARLRNGEIDVYSACHECEPVFTENGMFRHQQLAEHHPWCCWTLTVSDDRIIKINPDRVETREDVRKKLAKQGSTPLPDDDRAVQRALARWREHR